MKFLDKDIFKLKASDDTYLSVIEFLLKELTQLNKLQSVLLIRVDIESDSEIEIIGGYNIVISPFNGTGKSHIIEFINNCNEVYNKFHYQKMSPEFYKFLKHVEPSKVFSYRILYAPVKCKDAYLVIIGFQFPKNEELSDQTFYDNCDDILNVIQHVLNEHVVERRLVILESYVKEVGHDIASSVQATISKLRNISRGLIEGEIAKKKAKEAEEEILSTYRVAENLGFVVDPNYNIRDGEYFNIYESLSTVVVQYKSEAAERKIDLQLKSNNMLIKIWGDEKAIESAVGQMILNAIKYAHGSTFVTIEIKEFKNDIGINVSDVGIPVTSSDKNKIWEFGYRGKNALDRHVNGSGIGLFTVKKIVKAHGGNVEYIDSGDSKNLITFCITIPKDNIMAKNALL